MSASTLNEVIADLPPWMVAIIVGTTTMIAGLALRRLLRGPARRLAGRIPGSLDEIILAALARTSTWFLVAIALGTAAQTASGEGRLRTLVDHVVLAVVVLQCGLWIQHMLRGGIGAWLGSASTGTLPAALLLIGRVAIWSLVVVIILQNVGVEVGGLLAGLGVGGVAAALALQSTLADLFGAMAIYSDRPFDIGDFIITDDYLGTVEHIGLRSTRLAGLGGEQLIIPNSDLAGTRLRNYRRMEQRRIVTKLSLTYATSSDQLHAVPKTLRAIVESVEGVRFDRAHFSRFAESAFEIELVYYVLSRDYNVFMDKQEIINFAVMRAFSELGVKFALPSRTVYLHQPQAS